MDNSIRKVTTTTEVTVDKVYTTEYQKEGTKTAQLRQVLTTKSFYPSKQASNSLTDDVFSNEEFGFSEQEFENVEKRVAWINVPAIIENKDDVAAKLPKTATLYRFLSNHPVLTDSQKYAIDEGILQLDAVAESQVVRYGEGHTEEGDLALDKNNKPQYRAVFYASTAKADVDNRTNDADDFFATPLIQSELTGENVITGQELG